MSELQSALDALAADDLHALDDGAVLDRTALLVAAQNAITAELTRTVRHARVTQAPEHDGLKSMRSWLVGHVRLSAGEADRMARAGQVLEHLPAVAAGFAVGAVTAAQVEVIAKALGPSEVARAQTSGIDLAGFDADWAVTASESRHEALVTAVQVFKDFIDPDGPEPDPTEGRRLQIATHPDGSVSLRG